MQYNKTVTVYFQALTKSYFCVVSRKDRKYSIAKLSNGKWKPIRIKLRGGPLFCKPTTTALEAEEVLKQYIITTGYEAKKYNYVWHYFPTPEIIATSVKATQYKKGK